MVERLAKVGLLLGLLLSIWLTRLVVSLVLFPTVALRFKPPKVLVATPMLIILLSLLAPGVRLGIVSSAEDMVNCKVGLKVKSMRW